MHGFGRLVVVICVVCKCVFVLRCVWEALGATVDVVGCVMVVWVLLVGWNGVW